jgi:hypothetical protein
VSTHLSVAAPAFDSRAISILSVVIRAIGGAATSASIFGNAAAQFIREF